MAARNGDITSTEFEGLYRLYKPRFLQIACAYIRNEMVAEDIVTDSFVYFWENRDKLTINTSVPSYILASVKHGCLEWLRREKTRLKIQQLIHTTEYRSLQAKIRVIESNEPKGSYVTEVSAIIEDAIDRMPEPMRSIFVANRFEGKTYQEISRETGIRLRTVTAYIQRALALMRVALKDYLMIILILLAFNR
ncbi:RNA polymerase sigma-70 factor [Alistipes sp.]|uniref:RNA polymerase sigma-70 factor n=1 Tax=Alistipes sp. TaxID=1872444 RepID=UPI003AF0510F